MILPRVGINASFAQRMPRKGDLAFLSQSGALVTGRHRLGACARHRLFARCLHGRHGGRRLRRSPGCSRRRSGQPGNPALHRARDAGPKFLSAARRAARAKPGRGSEVGPACLGREGRDVAYGRAVGLRRRLRRRLPPRWPSAGPRVGSAFPGGRDVVFHAAARGRAARNPHQRRRRGRARGRPACRFRRPPRRYLGHNKGCTFCSFASDVVQGNPVDIIGDAGPERYEAALSALLDDETSDAILVINCPTALASSELAAKAVIEMAAARKRCGKRVKPLLTNWLGDGAADVRPARFCRGEDSNVRNAGCGDRRLHAARAPRAIAG